MADNIKSKLVNRMKSKLSSARYDGKPVVKSNVLPEMRPYKAIKKSLGLSFPTNS